MKTLARTFAAAAFAILPVAAFAQADDHHPADAGAAAAPAPAAAGLPAQCAAMMPMMQQMMQMMSMMQGQGGMTQGMPMGAGMMSDATKAYMTAMSMMDGPMMMGAQASDPDIAFVKAMIPHHQGAIDMAKAVLQYGKDDKVKQWAAEIITAQEAEIARMQAWLKEHGQ
jgi:uncharacterized protein (DUF305 family)